MATEIPFNYSALNSMDVQEIGHVDIQLITGGNHNNVLYITGALAFFLVIGYNLKFIYNQRQTTPREVPPGDIPSSVAANYNYCISEQATTYNNEELCTVPHNAYTYREEATTKLPYAHNSTDDVLTSSTTKSNHHSTKINTSMQNSQGILGSLTVGEARVHDIAPSYSNPSCPYGIPITEGELCSARFHGSDRMLKVLKSKHWYIQHQGGFEDYAGNTPPLNGIIPWVEDAYSFYIIKGGIVTKGTEGAYHREFKSLNSPVFSDDIVLALPCRSIINETDNLRERKWKLNVKEMNASAMRFAEAYIKDPVTNPIVGGCPLPKP